MPDLWRVSIGQRPGHTKQLMSGPGCGRLLALIVTRGAAAHMHFPRRQFLTMSPLGRRLLIKSMCKQVAETFSLELDESTQKDLSEIARLDTCVTVVDAAQLMANFESLEMLRQRDPDVAAEDDRSVPDLLLDQIEFADVIVINKVALTASSTQALPCTPADWVMKSCDSPSLYIHCTVPMKPLRQHCREDRSNVRLVITYHIVSMHFGLTVIQPAADQQVVITSDFCACRQTL